tara:strand:- start:22 stop:474 length:453 start_codon:yes stop_codon:yes gene_type:complete
MARRKSKPKERTRSVSLDLDVSEIAQKLADRGELSSSISELLRQAYGFGDELEEKKRELHVILDQITAMNKKKEDLEIEIDKSEEEWLHKQTFIVPELKKKLVTLRAKRDLCKTQAEHAIDSTIRSMKYRAIEAFETQISDILKQLEGYE